MAKFIFFFEKQKIKTKEKITYRIPSVIGRLGYFTNYEIGIG